MVDAFDDLIGRIADGEAVDWDEASALARDDTDRALLVELRLIARLHDTHREGDLAQQNTLPIDPGPQPSAVALPAVGSRWGRYMLAEHVGDGGFGAVYRAHDGDLRRDLAIKLLHPGVSGHDDHGARVLHEARALARIHHPNVVTVYGVETHDGRVGLCMEFIEGRTLDDRVRRDGPLNADEAVVVGQAVAQGLAAIHHAGLLHRDVKAKNVMRQRAGRLVLMDLGTGLELGDAARQAGSSSVGTPLYMAPELFAGGHPSIHSDVYSLGVLLYFLVTGSHPVEADSVDGIQRAHVEGRRTLLVARRPDLPLAFARLVERALAVDPQQRFASANELVEALSRSSPAPLPAPAPHRLSGVTASGVLAAGAVVVALGAISSRYFNLTLGRSGFANEDLADWFVIGLQSLVAPLVVAALGTSAISLALALRPIAVSAWAPLRRLDAAVRHRLRRLHLDNLTVVTAGALVAAAAMLALTWWRCLPTLVALVDIFPDVSSAPARALAFLAPEHVRELQAYRERLAWCTFACAAVWFPVVRLAAHQRQPVNRPLVLGGVAVFALSLVLLDFPYRLLVQNKFEAATWRDNDCYVLGERSGSVLLFCPGLVPPRNRTVNANSPELTRTGVTGAIFERIRDAR